MHFRVKLDAVNAPFGAAHDSPGAVGAAAQQLKAGRKSFHTVAVRHPHRIFTPRHEGVIHIHAHFGVAVFAFTAGGYLAAQVMGQQLHTVADTQHGQAGIQHIIRQGGRALFIYRVWPARQDITLGVQRQDFFRRGIPVKQLAIHLQFAHAARDQLGILRPIIQDNNRIGHGPIMSLAAPAGKQIPSNFPYMIKTGCLTALPKGHYNFGKK